MSTVFSHVPQGYELAKLHPSTVSYGLLWGNAATLLYQGSKYSMSKLLPPMTSPLVLGISHMLDQSTST